jgi:hypothetical protein
MSSRISGGSSMKGKVAASAVNVSGTSRSWVAIVEVDRSCSRAKVCFKDMGVYLGGDGLAFIELNEAAGAAGAGLISWQ